MAFAWATPLCLAVLLLAPVGRGGSTALTLEELEATPLVALRGERFSFSAEFAWEPNRAYNSSDRIFWQVLRDAHRLHAGAFEPLDGFGALRTRQRFNVSDSKLGRHRYTLQLGLQSDFSNATAQSFRTHVIAGGATLLPPLFTLLAVLATRQVLLALYVGVFMASFVIYEYNPITAFARSFDTMITQAFADAGHVQVILFTWFLSGMIACVLKSGGGTPVRRASAGPSASEPLRPPTCSWLGASPLLRLTLWGRRTGDGCRRWLGDCALPVRQEPSCR
jgi:hypothetical protein